MTEHSIKELRLQLDAAESGLKAARANVWTAQSALTDALIKKGEADFAAEGITPGTKVVSIRGLAGVYMGHCRTRVGHNAIPLVHKIKKDGTAHATQKAYGNGWRLPE